MNPTRLSVIALTALFATAACGTTQTASGGDTNGLVSPVAADAVAADVAAAEPTTSAPVTAPSPTSPPPAEVAPVTIPPVTVPPVTVPPVTTPPVTIAPVTTPPVPTAPVTIPPVFEVPETVPPFTIPPVVEVAVTVPPITIAPVIVLPPPPDCGVFGDIPGAASNVEIMVIDVDDDGLDDTVTTYFAAIGDSAGWRLRTELANGPMDDIAIEGVGPGVARILGGVQVDYAVVDPATWTRELLVQAGANSSGPNLTVFGHDDDGCLFRFEDDGGTDLVLAIHGSIGVVSGLRCDAIAGQQFLVTLLATHTVGTTYAATQTILERNGTALEPSTVIASDIDSDAQADWFNQFGQLNCGAVTL